MRVLQISPHPDDELLGAPATLIALAQAGHEVVNLAVSLGRDQARPRREAEVREACARAGFELIVSSPPHSISRGDDLAASRVRLTDELVRLGAKRGFDLLVGPSPHDGHHAHELVGRAAAVASAALRVPLWLWGLWGELPIPTILHPFDQEMLERIMDALAAHAGELERNDYRRLLVARSRATAVLGPERVFGFGASGIAASHAELLCEVVPRSGSMLLGAARVLDPRAPLAPPTDADISFWLVEPSVRDRLGR